MRRLVFGVAIMVGAAIITATWHVKSTRVEMLICHDEPIMVSMAAPERPPKILLVEHTPRGRFRAALDGLEVTGGSLPTTAQDLAAYDLVIVSDVPAHVITDQHMTALEAYVEAGGAVLMAGGIDSFGSGGYSATRMERLSPVRFDSDRKSQPDYALVVVVDTTEIPKEVGALPEVLSPSDFFAVVGPDANDVVRLQRAANRQRIADSLNSVSATDTANLALGLRRASKILDGIHATIKHVIVVTSPTSPIARVGDLVREMREAGITTSTVSAPKQLAKEAELAQRRIDDELVRVRAAKPGDKIAGTFHHVPPLHGYVSTRPKPTAKTILVSGTGEPILARWCRGDGTVAVWTSDLEGPWSVDWLAWDGYAELWREVVNMRRSECRRDRPVP